MISLLQNPENLKIPSLFDLYLFPLFLPSLRTFAAPRGFPFHSPARHPASLYGFSLHCPLSVSVCGFCARPHLLTPRLPLGRSSTVPSLQSHDSSLTSPSSPGPLPGSVPAWPAPYSCTVTPSWQIQECSPRTNCSSSSAAHLRGVRLWQSVTQAEIRPCRPFVHSSVSLSTLVNKA